MSEVVPYHEGLLRRDPELLIQSFAGEPEVHDPVRGRVRGADTLRNFVTQQHAWLMERNASLVPVHLVATRQRTVEEIVLHLRQGERQVELPVAVVSHHASDGKLLEVRVYHSSYPLSGKHAIRPPLLQPDPSVHVGDVVEEYQKALASGDLDAILAAFDPSGYAREPSGGEFVFRGTERLREFYGVLFSNGGGIPLEHCTITDDGRACAIEYNAVQWGRTSMRPQAGVAVYERAPSGRLAAARIYDDVDPPLSHTSPPRPTTF